MSLKIGKSAKTFKANIKELYADNKKTGRAKGANGKPRSKAQILAIAYAQKRRA